MGRDIALMGGSFNPIHLGHLAMAAAARDAGMDEVVLMPAGDPPHKGSEVVSKWDRLEMTRLASGGEFRVLDLEVLREGKTYTVDTLEALKKENPEDRLWMIIGADTLHLISGWRNAPRVFQLCNFLAFSRKGSDIQEVPGARVRVIETEIPDISSTGIRKAISEGKFLEGIVPKAVENYIGEKRIYDPPPLKSFGEIEEKLKSCLKPGRFAHTMGVVETMENLARAWGMDIEKARLCGLLHDCAKNLSLEEMQRMVENSGMQVDAQRMNSEALLHGIAGAAKAKAEFGVTDPEILQAIRVHTTGCVGMSMLDDMLYLADLTEPTRKPFDGLEEIRVCMYSAPCQALEMAMLGTLKYVQAMGNAVHPDTLSALRDVQGRKEKALPTI